MGSDASVAGTLCVTATGAGWTSDASTVRAVSSSGLWMATGAGVAGAAGAGRGDGVASARTVVFATGAAGACRAGAGEGSGAADVLGAARGAKAIATTGAGWAWTGAWEGAATGDGWTSADTMACGSGGAAGSGA